MDSAVSRAGRTPRSDARRNREHLLEIAREVLAEQGAQASLREIARRAQVGMGTLYRHFPNREALLEALLGQSFERLTALADTLARTHEPRAALVEWLRTYLAGSITYRGLVTAMMSTLADESSALSAACADMREAAANLLRRAQDSGEVRADVDRIDVIALISAVGWITEQAPQLAGRGDHLFAVIVDALAPRAGTDPP
ncbi:TetR/AcrR family transcriptional regulator [Nocardia bovistercoris]|uniref:TetR/AcrR family transcriptional regulator n=1 Tax=Nocardia bovistercoris TaxID=2785916 RepID=UPI001E429C9E|nr:TetR/AcrR family transcriptional regulator [Nocardia bovistercoris]